MVECARLFISLLDYTTKGTFMNENEAALLITCLRGLPFVVPRDTDWEELLGLASAHGVLLLVHQSFLERGVEIPDFFATAVRESLDAAKTLAAELETRASLSLCSYAKDCSALRLLSTLRTTIQFKVNWSELIMEQIWPRGCLR